MTIRKIFKKHSNLTSLAEGESDYMMDEEDFTNAAKELIEYHVTQALKTADENATVTVVDYEDDLDPPSPIWGVSSDSILNSYPLNLIK